MVLANVMNLLLPLKTWKNTMMVQAKIIQKCTINVPANDPGYGRTTKNLNGN